MAYGIASAPWPGVYFRYLRVIPGARGTWRRGYCRKWSFEVSGVYRLGGARVRGISGAAGTYAG
eukprot:3351804-Pleurochrysis_carterae.AAC.1